MQFLPCALAFPGNQFMRVEAAGCELDRPATTPAVNNSDGDRSKDTGRCAECCSSRSKTSEGSRCHCDWSYGADCHERTMHRQVPFRSKPVRAASSPRRLAPDRLPSDPRLSYGRSGPCGGFRAAPASTHSPSSHDRLRSSNWPCPGTSNRSHTNNNSLDATPTPLRLAVP